MSFSTFDGVVASYGTKKALALPSLIIRPGEKIGVLGPIGAGKTTLLRLLSGMYKPQEGRILLDDIDLGHLSKPVCRATASMGSSPGSSWPRIRLSRRVPANKRPSCWT